MLQGVRGGEVGAEFRIEVTEDSDANGFTHVVIVLNRALKLWETVRCVVRCGGVIVAAKTKILALPGMTMQMDD
jgi:hypothetical protein